MNWRKSIIIALCSIVVLCTACHGDNPHNDEPRLPETPTETPNSPDNPTPTPSDSTSTEPSSPADTTDVPNTPIVDISNITQTLCNPDASTQASQLYTRMLANYGKKTYSGITEPHINTTPLSDKIFNSTQKRPKIVFYDLENLHTDSLNNIENIIAHISAGGYVGYTWNWLTPASSTDNPQNYSADSPFSIAKALIDSNWEFQFLLSDIEKFAKHCDKLRQAGITVIFNPLASHNPNRWWTRKTALHFTELWKLLYDQLAVRHQLNNLIWVWTAPAQHLNTPSTLTQWYPGDRYVDIIGVNLCESSTSISQNDIYTTLHTTFEGKKMLALSQCRHIPSTSSMWLYFNILPPTTSTSTAPSIEEWSNILNNQHTISLP